MVTKSPSQRSFNSISGVNPSTNFRIIIIIRLRFGSALAFAHVYEQRCLLIAGWAVRSSAYNSNKNVPRNPFRQMNCPPLFFSNASNTSFFKQGLRRVFDLPLPLALPMSISYRDHLPPSGGAYASQTSP